MRCKVLRTLSTAAELAQLGVVIELDHLGVGLSFFLSLGAFALDRLRRAAVSGDLAGVIGKLAGADKGQVWIAPQGQPFDLGAVLLR